MELIKNRLLTGGAPALHLIALGVAGAIIASGAQTATPPPESPPRLSAAAAGTGESTDDEDGLELHGPAPQSLEAIRAATRRLAATRAAPAPGLRARARWFTTRIYSAAGAKAWTLGYAREGALLPVEARVGGSGCASGRWYRVSGGGFVCTTHGVAVEEPEVDAPDAESPVLHLELRYGRVITPGAPRFSRVPSAAELEQVEQAEREAGAWPKVVDKQMKGVWFLAIAEALRQQEQVFYRTVRGHYVRATDVQILPFPRMHGELLGGAVTLPLAFVYGEPRAIYEIADGIAERVGTSPKHARFRPQAVVEHGGERYVVGPRQILVPEEGVRTARMIAPPRGIPAGQKWVHVDLSEQTLVAYRGKKPVFATIISSGRAGYEPPPGVFRVTLKHVTDTMSGADPDEGWYEVEEVPWAMYYHRGYAVHGAYWHDDFGNPRSHGCTNVAPADAEWLFRWAAPQLPTRWHSLRRTGIYLYFTK